MCKQRKKKVTICDELPIIFFSSLEVITLLKCVLSAVKQSLISSLFLCLDASSGHVLKARVAVLGAAANARV